MPRARSYWIEESHPSLTLTRDPKPENPKPTPIPTLALSVTWKEESRMRQMSSDSLLTIVFVSLSKSTCTRRVHSARIA